MKIGKYLLGILFSTVAMGISAAPISGTLLYAGLVIPVTSGTLSETTKLDFNNNQGFYNINAALGDFADIAEADLTVFDLVIDSFVSPTMLWKADGFEFFLSSLTVVPSAPNYLTLSGRGYVEHANFGKTHGTWQFSANTAGSMFNFSAGSVAAPEPSTLALFGLTMLGMGLAGRRRKLVSKN